MLTVAELVDDAGLRLAAGEEAAGNAVRWVHITELEDPTPWLSGGELLLTTGLQLADAKAQRAFVRRLSEHALAGLGLGTGFQHPQLPDALVEEARKRRFPLFEVPYATPFIAITERAYARIAGEHVERLRRAMATQERLERLVLEERGLEEVVRALAAAIGGTAAVLDVRGEPLAASGDPEAARGEMVRLPVGAQARAWLLAARPDGRLGDYERLIVQQAVTVVGLELMRRRVMRETERRLAGDVLAEAIGGRLGADEVEARLRPFGVGPEAAVIVFDLDDPEAAEPGLHTFLAGACGGALVAVRDGLLCAVVDSDDPPALAAQAREALGGPRAAASRRAPAGALRRSFHEARCALEAARLGNGSAPEVATWEDLGAYRLLLALQDDEALRLYADSVLGPLEQAEGYGSELLRSLEVFIEENGNWERAARALPCHRHTLRYRVRRIEELTGRDLGNARERVECWLALRARELVS